MIAILSAPPPQLDSIRTRRPAVLQRTHLIFQIGDLIALLAGAANQTPQCVKHLSQTESLSDARIWKAGRDALASNAVSRSTPHCQANIFAIFPRPW
jgi:hypothetical protein